MRNPKTLAVAEFLRHGSYQDFSRWGFMVLHGGAIPDNLPYVRFLVDHMELVVTGKVRRSLVNLAPRHGKTLWATVFAIAWLLAHHPAKSILLISYGDALSEFIAEQVLALLEAPAFKLAFRCRVKRKTRGEFVTMQGGGLLATSITGRPQGRGADAIFVDDIHRVESSPAQLEKDISGFSSKIASRLNVPAEGIIAVAGHRVSEFDLSGHLMKRGDYVQLALPFVAERAQTLRSGQLVWRRRKGELLRPGAFTPHDVDAARSSSQFRWVYQQGVDAGERRINPNKIGTFSGPLPTSACLFSIDPASGEGSGCSFSVVQVWATAGANRYLVHQERQQISLEGLLELVGRLHERYNPSVILIESDGLGAGFAVAVRAKSRVRGFAVLEVPTHRKSKQQRLERVLPVINQGRVHFRAGVPWLPGLLERLRAFPLGESDDEVDALTQALLWTEDNEVPALPPRVQGLHLRPGASSTSINHIDSAAFNPARWHELSPRKL